MRSGIEHFFRNNAAMLRFLACLSGWRRHRFRFLSITRFGVPCCSCRVRSGDVIMMSSVSTDCLLPAAMSPCCHRFAFPLFAPHRLVVSPRLSCRETGSGRGCLLRFTGVVLVMRCGFGVVVMPCLWLFPSPYCLVWDDGGDCASMMRREEGGRPLVS